MGAAGSVPQYLGPERRAERAASIPAATSSAPAIASARVSEPVEGREEDDDPPASGAAVAACSELLDEPEPDDEFDPPPEEEPEASTRTVAVMNGCGVQW